MNCLTRSLDLLHEKGGWFAARASVHSEWGMHAIHIDRDGRVTSYVPPEPLLHPALSLSGFDGNDRHADYRLRPFLPLPEGRGFSEQNLMIYLCSYIGKGKLGNAVIRAWTGRQESHSELLMGNTTYASTVRDGGVRSQASRKTLATLEHWIIEPCKWITADQLIAHFAATQGQTYDWIGLVGSQVFNRGVNNKGAAFCSEWIAQAGGVPNPELYNPGTLRDLNRYLNEVVK